MKYRLQDIADFANVSVSTVWRVINNKEVVKANTRTLVLDAIEALDYKVDTIFTRPQIMNNYNVAIFLRESDYKKIFELKYGIEKMTEPISFKQEIESAGGKALFLEMDDIKAPELHKLIDRQKINGVIIFGAEDSDKELLIELEKMRVPFIVTNGISDFVKQRSLNFVEYDDFNGISAIVKHFKVNGRTNLAMINGPDKMWVCQERRNAFYHSIHELQIADQPLCYFSGEFDFKTGQDGVLRIKEQGLVEKIDGIICGSDIIAIGVIKELIRMGIDIPRKTAVFGYDDTPICEYFNPSISSVKRDLKHYSSYIIERLYDLIQTHNRLQIQIYIKTSLVFRRST